MATESKVAQYAENFPKISADSLLELFRELRQMTTSKIEQDVNSKEIIPSLELLVKIVDYLTVGTADNAIDKFVLSVCARVGVQFLGNSIVEHELNQQLMWSHSQMLRKIFLYKDSKLKNYISMVYLNILISFGSARDELLNDDELVNELLDEAMLGLGEFPQFIVEKLLEYNLYYKLFTDKRKSVHKIFILDMLSSLMRKENGLEINSITIDKISNDFKNEAEIILNGRKQNPEQTDGSIAFDEDPFVAVKLLSTLCSLSINEKYNMLISDNTSLVINIIYVLRAMKMSQTADTEATTESNEAKPPVIGFKADLIRLVGNLCYKNKKNQDLVRENNCIPIILDSCKLDETNPFICEWSIMAIKNLCQDNKENCDFIKSLQRINGTDVTALIERINVDQALSGSSSENGTQD